jgi:hypothetical protein
MEFLNHKGQSTAKSRHWLVSKGWFFMSCYDGVLLVLNHYKTIDKGFAVKIFCYGILEIT